MEKYFYVSLSYILNITIKLTYLAYYNTKKYGICAILF